MKLFVGTLWTYIEGKHPKQILDPITSYRIDGYWFADAFKKGFWDGYYRFIKYDKRKKQYFFATGFIDRITNALDEAEWRYELHDEREFTEVEARYSLFPDIDLRTGKYDYQAGALDRALQYGRGIVQIPTGGGKTEVGAGIFSSVEGKCLWLTHRQNLAYQTQERLRTRLGEEIGLVGDGSWDLNHRVTVAMVQTLTKYLDTAKEFLDDIECVIGDEIHHLESGQWYETFGAIQAEKRFGLSATPHLKGEGLSLIAMTGEIIYHIGVQELIDRGVLVQPRIWCIPIETPKELDGPFATIYKYGVVDNSDRNNAICAVAHQFAIQDLPCLVVVKQIRHGEILTDQLIHKGVRAQFIRGQDSAHERGDAVERLAEGRLDTIVATSGIFGEGQDIPALRAVINATGSRGGGNSKKGDSGRGTIQLLGRGVRASPGKEFFDYVDIVDKTHKFLRDAAIDRIETLEHEGYLDFVRYWSEYPHSSLDSRTI